MSKELMVADTLFLLYGEIPVERLCLIDGVINNRDDEDKFVKDLRENLC